MTTPCARVFNATLECELLTRQRFRPNEAFFTIFDFLEGWYYPDRRHSELCYLLTNNYERRTSNAA